MKTVAPAPAAVSAVSLPNVLTYLRILAVPAIVLCLFLVPGDAGRWWALAVYIGACITDIALVGVAKGPDRDAGREHFHFPGRDKPLLLEPRDPVLYFVQRLRDEAHRFAIGTHRAKRSKAIGANPLDEIGGVGANRKRALLQHFGSARAVAAAGLADIEKVEGVSRTMAKKIFDFFHPDG